MHFNFCFVCFALYCFVLFLDMCIAIPGFLELNVLLDASGFSNVEIRAFFSSGLENCFLTVNN